MRKILLIILMFLYSAVTVCLNAQSARDSIAINDANNVIHIVFEQKIIPDNFLIYSSPNGIVLIFEQDNMYYHKLYSKTYIFETYQQPQYDLQKEFTTFKPKSKKAKRNNVVYQMFSGEILCSIDYYFVPDDIASCYSFSDYYQYEYFLLYSQGVKVCEFNVPISFLIDQNHNKTTTKYPELNKSWYDYLKKQIY